MKLEVCITLKLFLNFQANLKLVAQKYNNNLRINFTNF